MISTALRRMIEPVIEDLPGWDSTAVGIVAATNTGDWGWLVEQEMISFLRQKGAMVYLHPAPPDSATGFRQIYYAPVHVSIEYKASGSVKGRMERLVQVALLLRILDDDDRVLFSQTVSHDVQDSIRRKDIHRIENPAYSFTKGEIKSAGLLNRLLEPLLVTIVTGGIIYLFYSFRTQS
ncbi:hypothetical protein JXO59_14145 [candidate division KSB1 bacterium]|nr:hypothetical protein [candidate division KSB1 bacterium]